MSTITLHVPAPVAAPRGAALFGAVYGTVVSGFVAWRQTQLQRRAQASRAAEAAEVRAYAWQLMNEDPRFAADLLAAVDRHEQRPA